LFYLGKVQGNSYVLKRCGAAAVRKVTAARQH
jgi:hypothetical protein